MDLPAYVGRFEIRHEIATGGFAAVLQAWDEELACLVALKVLLPKFASDIPTQTRFLEEARMLRRIRSPNVVTVHDVGRLHDGRPYFVMDFADRGTLAARLGSRAAGRGGPDSNSLVALVEAMADGLGAIHASGLVHRDIKPANLLFQLTRGSITAPSPTVEAGQPAHFPVGNDERILIGDLGIAKDLVKGPAAATILGGTPLYQAPEQSDPAARITPAADVYAATAILWVVLSGDRPPAVSALSHRLADFSGRWKEVMATGLALDPADRFKDMETWRAAIHEALAQEAVDEQLDVPTEAGIHQPACPFKGLTPYQPEDADVFYGRESLVDEIIRRVQRDRVLAIGGPSGSGKSSVVRAGLVPALKAGALPDSDKWRFALFTPGRDPLAALYVQLTRGLPESRPRPSIEDVVGHPAMARHLEGIDGSGVPLVLCIDQFEELFTLANETRRAGFISALSAVADPADSNVRVVIIVRADFYAACAQIPWLVERFTSNQVLVGPMTRSELRRAVSEPVRQAGLRLEHGLIDAIVKAAGNETGALPLVAHALVETWMRREGNSLTLKGFRDAGGVAGAISQTAEAIFNDRFSAQEREVTQRLFLRLVNPGMGTPDTRRIMAQSELQSDTDPDVMQRVVKCLTESRMLTVDDTSVQIAHEALLRTWPRLQAWIEASRDELRTRQRIAQSAAQWDAEGRHPDFLYHGTPLLSALEWMTQNPEMLGELEQAFLDASAETKSRYEAIAAQKARRTRKVRRAIVTSLALLALGTTLATLVAYSALRQARLNEERAVLATAAARERFAAALAVGAHEMVARDPLLALALAAEAVARAWPHPPAYDARATMVDARRMLTNSGPFLVGSPLSAGDALAIAMTPDGKMIASAQRDGAIDLIDTDTGRPIVSGIRGHEGGIRDVEFSPDGRRLVSAGADGLLRLWTLGDDGFSSGGRKIGESADVIMGVRFSPDGSTVATGNGDGTVQLWDVANGTPIGEPIIDLTLGFNTVEFSHDGRGVLASIHDGTIYGWAMPSREPLFAPIYGAHTSHLLKIAFSPAGDRFATASTDGTAMVFEYPSGRLLGPAFSSEDRISAVVFSHDGRVLIGGNADGGLRLWDVARNARIENAPRGHGQAIIDAALSQAGDLLATLGQDQMIRLWSFDKTYPLFSQYEVVGKSAKGIAFSNDGKLLAAGDDTGVVQVWEMATNKLRFLLHAHDHQVWALAFSPGSHYLASGDRSGKIRLWRLADGSMQRVLEAQGGAIWSLAFRPDGKQLVSTDDGHIRLWDVATGSLQNQFKNEGGKNTRAALSPDGKWLAVATTDGTVRLWDVENGITLNKIKVDDDVLWSVAFAPDSRHLAVASSDEVVTVWDAATGARLTTLTGHAGGATDLAYLSDGVTLVVVDRRGMLHWWDLPTERRLSEPWPAHDRTCWRLAIHPDGERVGTAGDDGTVRLWDELSLKRACEFGQRAFDSVRQRQYLGRTERSLACD